MGASNEVVYEHLMESVFNLLPKDTDCDRYEEAVRDVRDHSAYGKAELAMALYPIVSCGFTDDAAFYLLRVCADAAGVLNVLPDTASRAIASAVPTPQET